MSAVEQPRAPRSTAKGRAAQRRVIEQALVLFQARGYHATSIREVAQAAGLAKATVYHHFQTKAALLYAIHDVFMETLEEGMAQITASGRPAEERLRAIIHELWRVMVTHRSHVHVFFEEWRYLDDESLRTLKPRRDAYFSFLRDTVAEVLEANGRSLGDEHVDVLTLGVFGMCNWGYQWFEEGGPLAAAGIADDYADLVIGGFRGGAGAR